MGRKMIESFQDNFLKIYCPLPPQYFDLYSDIVIVEKGLSKKFLDIHRIKIDIVYLPPRSLR